MDEPFVQQNVLTQMANLLNSDGVNYSVFFQAYTSPTGSENGIDNIIKCLIADDVLVSEIRDVNVTEVVETLRESLGYVDDGGAGPGANTLGSIEFSRLLNSILDDVLQLSENAYGIKSVEFAQGHPAYPVFWDFAFLFLRSAQHVLLVGSSSD